MSVIHPTHFGIVPRLSRNLISLVDEGDTFDNPLFNQWHRRRSASMVSLSNGSVRSAWTDDEPELHDAGHGVAFSNPMYDRRPPSAASSVLSLPASLGSTASTSKIQLGDLGSDIPAALRGRAKPSTEDSIRS